MRDFLSSVLPTLEWRNNSHPEIQCVETLGEGDFCTCYLVNRIHVIRIAKHAVASASLRREMLLLPKLAKHLEVQIPDIQDSGTQTGTGELFVVYPLVPGTVLDSEALSSLETSTCRSDLVRQMARFATQLHGFPVEIARACGLGELDLRQYLPDLMRRASEVLPHHLEEKIWLYYKRLVELYLDTPELHAYNPTLLHGDLSPDHFLADISCCRLNGVIDFGDAIIGDPYWDLIYVLEDYGKEILDLFLSFYSPNTKLAGKRVRVFQQLNNVEYCLMKLSEGDDKALKEAIATLVTQATSEAVV